MVAGDQEKAKDGDYNCQEQNNAGSRASTDPKIWGLGEQDTVTETNKQKNRKKVRTNSKYLRKKETAANTCPYNAI